MELIGGTGKAQGVQCSESNCMFFQEPVESLGAMEQTPSIFYCTTCGGSNQERQDHKRIGGNIHHGVRDFIVAEGVLDALIERVSF